MMNGDSSEYEAYSKMSLISTTRRLKPDIVVERIKAKYLSLTRSTYRIIADEFDHEFYGFANSDIPKNIDLVRHFIKFGWKEGRDPTPWFSVYGYLEANPDVKAAHVNPFYHYLKYGRIERRQLSPSYKGASLNSQGSDAGIALLSTLAADAQQSRFGEVSRRFGNPTPANTANHDHELDRQLLARFFSASEYCAVSGKHFANMRECLNDFIDHGCKELLPLSFNLAFDANFYRAYMNLDASLTDFDLYRQWLTRGILSGRAPNESVLFRQLNLQIDWPIDFFDDELYRWINDDLQIGNSVWAHIEHLVRVGIAERRPGCPLNEKSAALYVAAADNLVVNGREREGQRIYETVLYALPNHRRAMNHLADSLFWQEQFHYSAILYQRVVSSGVAPIFAHLNLANSLFMSGRNDEALEAIDATIAKFPEDNGIRLTRRQFLARTFEKRVVDAISYAAAMRRAECDREATAASEMLATAWEPTAIAPPRRQKIERVAIIGDHSLPQCLRYRIEQKLEQFAAAGISAESFRFMDDIDVLASRILEFDAIIFFRVPGWNETQELIATARQLGITTFYEIDDLIFDIANYPEAFESYGNYITRKEYGSLMSGAPIFRAAMGACDFGIASTAPLARHMEDIVRTGKVFVHRNALGRVHVMAIERTKKKRPCRVVKLFFGSGTKAHKGDFEELLAPALFKIFEKYGSSVALSLTGFQQLPPILARFAKLVTCRSPEWDITKYWSTLAEHDVNLAVLARSEATDVKSEIKWLEAGMFGIPSVVSRTANYAGIIENGVNGFLADTPDEWFHALDRLVASRDLRREVGAAAKAAVESNYGEGVMARNLEAMAAEVSALRQATPVVRKRILIVNVFYPPQAIGGATRVVHDNVREIAANYGDEFDIEVFATLMGEPTPYRLSSYCHEGIRVTTVGSPTMPDVETRPDDPKMQEVFTRFLAAFQPDLIHFHCVQRLTASLMSAARIFRIPYVVTVHDGWWISPRQFLVDELGNIETYSLDDRENAKRYGDLGAERARALRDALAGAKHVLAVSDPFASIYKRAGVENVLAVSNGVSSVPTASRVASHDGRVRIGYIGGLENHKGFPIVRSAFWRRRFNNLSLTIVDHSLGLGSERHERWNDTPVTFIGKRPQQKVGELYGSLDVLLAPSIWPESYGLVTREALSCGLWVIASDRGAVSESVVEGENGFVVDVSSSQGLENALSAIDAEPSKYRSPPAMRIDLRKSRDQADELVALYRKLLSTARSDQHAHLKYASRATKRRHRTA